MRTMLSVQLATLVLLAVQHQAAARGGFGICGDYESVTDTVAATHQADELLAGYAGETFNLVAWDSTSGEQSNTCYKMTIDSTAGAILITYVDSSAASQNFAATYTLVKGTSPYLDVTNVATVDGVMGHSGTQTVKWYINYMSETELSFIMCSGFFFLAETQYTFSTADLSMLSDTCITNTVQNIADFTTTRTVLTTC